MIDLEETGCFQPRAEPWRPADLGPHPKITCAELDRSPEKIIQHYPLILSKVIQLSLPERGEESLVPNAINAKCY